MQRAPTAHFVATADKAAETLRNYIEKWPGHLPEALLCGFVQLSAAYEAEATRSSADNWPVERISGHHLSMITEPDVVATAIMRLLEHMCGQFAPR